MSKKRLIPNIVRGGGAIPIPNKTNYYYMKGRKHKDGGIDIGKNPRTGLEVEDGEVLHLTNNNIKVYSSVPFLNGESPAEKVLNGENPDKVFKQQEEFKDKNHLNDDGTRKAKYGKAAVVRTPEDEKVSKLTRSYYKEVNPLAGYPGFIDAIKHGLNVFGRRYVETDSTAYPVTDKVADATWRKRLGLSYDEVNLPSNPDGSVRLPKDRELEMPIDTNLLKRRINANKALSDKYEKSGKKKSKEVVDWAIEEDQRGLDSLRHTYKTGEPVVINEQVYNSRSLINNGKVSMPGSSPLNPLQNYTLQYDKDRNVMLYRDVYDFNKFDWAVPGKGYKIKGEIDLNKKLMGGKNKITPEYAKLLGRRGMPGDKEALAAAGYNSKGQPLVRFKGGKFGGAGAGASFDSTNTNSEINDYVRNTPILRSFGDAFAEARKKGLNTFNFNGKEYSTKKSNNPKYVGKRYEPTLNIREVLDENKKVISDSTRIEPYLGQIPGTHKRIKKAIGGKMNKPVSVTVNGKTKIVYTPSTGGTRSEAEGFRNKGELGLIQPITKYDSLLERPLINGVTSRIVPKHLSYKTNRLPLVTIPKVNNTINMTQPATTSFINPVGSQKPMQTKIEENNFIEENKDIINDGLSLAGNITGSLLSNSINRKMLNKLKYGPAPTPKTAIKLKTNININPQLDKMRKTLAAYERNIDANTASSRVALARKNRLRNDAIEQYNTLLANKENQETQLINQDKLNRQSITNQNIEDYSTYLTNKTNFENKVTELKGENKVNLINNLNSAIQNTITTGEKRRRDMNSLIAMIAANPNVNPQILKDLGFNGITQNMIDRINKNRKG